MTMLDRMRRHKGWLKWSLALVVLAFVIFYIPSFLQDPTTMGASPREIVADVGGYQVTAGQFQQRYQAQLQAYRNAYGETMSDQLLRQLGIERQILQQMIDEQAALAEAERQGIGVSDEELAGQILAIPAFQENGQFIGEQRYEQVLRSQRPPLTKGVFEDNLRKSMMIDKLRAVLTGWLTASDAEVEREYRRRNEKVKLQTVALTASAFRDKVTVTDADVAAHFESRKADYRIGERRKIKFLVIDTAQVRAKTAVSPADVQRFYDDNRQQYTSPEQIRASHILLKTEGKDEAEVRKQAEAILQQARGGADFAELATKHSEDEATQAVAGDLDYFGRGRMVPEFENTAFSMEAGQISDLVKTDYGFHIIKLTDKKTATTRPLDEVRGEITEQLKSQRAEAAVRQQARTLGEQIDDPSDLDRVAREAGLAVIESGLFTREEPIPGLGMAPQVGQEAFRLKDGEVAGPLDSARGSVFIAVTGKEDPYVPALDAVKDKVREDLIEARATELSRQRAAQIATTLRTAKDFAAAAKAEGLEAKETELVAREAVLPDIGVSAAVDKVAFELPVNGVSDPIPTDNGTVIVRVLERDEVTPEELAEARDTFRREMLNERRNTFFSAYMNKAKEKMDITINDDVLQRIAGAVNP